MKARNPDLTQLLTNEIYIFKTMAILVDELGIKNPSCNMVGDLLAARFHIKLHPETTRRIMSRLSKVGYLIKTGLTNNEEINKLTNSYKINRKMGEKYL